MAHIDGPFGPRGSRMRDPRFLDPEVRNREEKEAANEDAERQTTTTDLLDESYGDSKDGPGLW